MIEFILNVPMEPVAKGRPRMTKTGHTYTPEKTRSAEGELKFWALKELKGKSLPLFDGPVALSVGFVFPRPKSVKRKWHTTRPDLDNPTKLVLDALNGIVWRDDSQICELAARKMYGETGMIRLTVWKLDE
jgi:Holliday junction resolvase RusA-like endonuclease